MKIRVLFAAAALGGLVVAGTTAAQQLPQVGTAPAFRTWSHKVAPAETTWALVARGIAAETASGVLTAAQETSFGQALRRATGTQPTAPHAGEILDYDPADIPAPAAPAPTTAPTTTLPATTTTVRPPNTTLPATTTTTTVRPPTTTTSVQPPTTTVPSPGVRFSATFDSPADFYDRFQTFAGNFVNDQGARTDAYVRAGGDTPSVVHADHDMACGHPATTRRDLDVATPDTSRYFFHCLPGGDPALGHVMTAFDTTGYAIMAFAPNRSFTNVTRVCWDINATELGGGKWTNMLIVPEAVYQQYAPRLDYVTSGFNADNAPGALNIQASDHPRSDVWGIKDARGSQTLFIGDREVFQNLEAHVTTDKAARYQHCVQETSATTSQLTVQRPNGTTSVFALPSGMPDGAVRVIFQDDMYDPPKRAGYSPANVTWHWDNIEIS